MNKFGVCNYDFNAYESKIENLEIYDSYEEAFSQYMKKLTNDEHYPYTWDKTLWYVWIEDNKIIQFEQLNTKTRYRMVGNLR